MIKRYILMVATIIGLSFSVIDNGFADIWLKDPTTGCQVWSWDDGAANEIVSWSGSCADDKAIGIGNRAGHRHINEAASTCNDLPKGMP